MKKFLLTVPLLFLISCGGTGDVTTPDYKGQIDDNTARIVELEKRLDQVVLDIDKLDDLINGAEESEESEGLIGEIARIDNELRLLRLKDVTLNDRITRVRDNLNIRITRVRDNLRIRITRVRDNLRIRITNKIAELDIISDSELEAALNLLLNGDDEDVEVNGLLSLYVLIEDLPDVGSLDGVDACGGRTFFIARDDGNFIKIRPNGNGALRATIVDSTSCGVN